MSRKENISGEGNRIILIRKQNYSVVGNRIIQE